MRIACLLALVALPAVARDANPSLLGIVALEAKDAVVVGLVLPDSPAAAAGLAKGDRLLFIADREIERADHVDAALRSVRPGEEVAVELKRDGKKRTLKATVMARREYRHAFLKRRAREGWNGETGFEAPAWHAFAWANVPAGGAAPTRANTKGKVVVFHAFQSW